VALVRLREARPPRRSPARPAGAWHIGKRYRGGIADIEAGEERRPDDVASTAHIVGVHVQEFDRGKNDAGATEHVSLDRNVVDVMILESAAALDLTQAPGAGRKALQHINTAANAVVFERGLEDGRDARICHQRSVAGDGRGMLPGLFGDLDAARKQELRLTADLLADIERRAGRRLFVRLRVVDAQPEPALALQAGHVA